MNLFEELEGRSGETLAVSVLRMLLLRSPGCREATMQVLDSVSPIGRLETRSHFSCYSEHPTTDPDLGDGRIDLVLELDSAVLGIEAKFGASFGPDQPEKYRCEMRRLAE